MNRKRVAALAAALVAALLIHPRPRHIRTSRPTSSSALDSVRFQEILDVCRET